MGLIEIKSLLRDLNANRGQSRIAIAAKIKGLEITNTKKLADFAGLDRMLLHNIRDRWGYDPRASTLEKLNDAISKILGTN